MTLRNAFEEMATEATLDAINTKTPALVSGAVPVDGSAVTQPVSGPVTDAQLRATPVPVSAATLPLPTGASTETTLAAINTKFPTKGAGTINQSMPVNIASNQTVPISAASLPLPTGAATEATLSALSAKVPSLGQAAMAASQPVVVSSDQSAIPVSAASLPLPTGAASETTLAAANAKLPTLVSGRMPVDGSAVTQPVSAAALPLPTGAATETTLAAVNTKIPALGQALMAASTPVVLASNHSAVPISAASLPLPTGAATETTLSALNTKMPALGQALMASSQPVTIASNQSAVPVSAASLPLPSGAATEATLSTLSGKVPSLGQAAMAASQPVVIASNQTAVPVSAASLPLPTGAATESTLSSMNGKMPALGQALMASSQPVAISSDQSAIPVSAASLPLPTGAATEATLALVSTEATLSAMNAKMRALGQTTMANSMPVVIASNQSALPVTTLIPGTAATNLGKAEDAVAASGDTGVFALGIRRDDTSGASPVSASGDYNELAVNRKGAQYIAKFEHGVRCYRSYIKKTTFAANATDFLDLFGQVTTTVEVRRIRIWGVATGAAVGDIYFIKRSTATSAGTSTGLTALKMNSADSAASSSVRDYTANPTPGTAEGTMIYPLVLTASGAALAPPLVIDFTETKPPVLIGTAQGIALNLNGIAIPGGLTLYIEIDWLEYVA